MDIRNKALANHRIDRIELLYFRARYPRLHGFNAIKGYHGFGGETPIARLTTNQGASGWGVLSEKLPIAEQMREQLLGKELTEVFACEEGILDDKWKVFDLALHDLAARILGIPVSKMLNPDAVSRVRMYDGAIYMNDLIPEDKPWGIQKVLDDCAYDVELGHRALKIKIGRGHMFMEHDAGMKRDIEVVSRIHDQFPSMTLMVDANDGYTVQDAKDFLTGVKHIPLYWFEEPMREEENNFRALKEFIMLNCPETRIADGENRTDIPLLTRLAEERLLDVWQPDVCEFGFTAWRRLLKMMTQKGYVGSPHAWGYVAKTNCCAHIAAAFPQHIPYIEAVLGDCEGVDLSGYSLKDGMLTVPDKPGFGMDLDLVLEIGKTF
ncbi:MAG: enolase C-terminal domain-like protein [bacterium]|nr:enolase C-terminal domain-like protein [bacterium]